MLFKKLRSNYKADAFFQGLKQSLPVCIAFFFIFISVGVLSNEHGVSFLQSTLMTATIFASPLQVALLQNPELNIVSFSTIFIISLIVNFRFLMMSTVIAPYFKHEKMTNVFLSLIFLSASTFTVSYLTFQTAKGKFHYFAFFLGLSIAAYATAVIATSIGYVLMNHFDSPVLFGILSMMLPIHFSALSAKHWPKIKPIFATLLGFVAIPFAKEIVSHYVLLIVPLLVGFLFVVRYKNAT